MLVLTTLACLLYMFSQLIFLRMSRCRLSHSRISRILSQKDTEEAELKLRVSFLGPDSRIFPLHGRWWDKWLCDINSQLYGRDHCLLWNHYDQVEFLGDIPLPFQPLMPNATVKVLNVFPKSPGWKSATQAVALFGAGRIFKRFRPSGRQLDYWT